MSEKESCHENKNNHHYPDYFKFYRLKCIVISPNWEFDAKPCRKWDTHYYLLGISSPFILRNCCKV